MPSLVIVAFYYRFWVSGVQPLTWMSSELEVACTEVHGTVSSGSWVCCCIWSSMRSTLLLVSAEGLGNKGHQTSTPYRQSGMHTGKQRSGKALEAQAYQYKVPLCQRSDGWAREEAARQSSSSRRTTAVRKLLFLCHGQPGDLQNCRRHWFYKI